MTDTNRSPPPKLQLHSILSLPYQDHDPVGDSLAARCAAMAPADDVDPCRARGERMIGRREQECELALGRLRRSKRHDMHIQHARVEDHRREYMCTTSREYTREPTTDACDDDYSTTSVQAKIVNGVNFSVWLLRPATTSVT